MRVMVCRGHFKWIIYTQANIYIFSIRIHTYIYICSSPPRHQAPVCNTQKKVLVHLWCNSCSKCYAMNCFGTYLHTLHTSRNLGLGGGVGWGAMTCTVIAHIFDATQLYLRTCSMLRNCTCAHVGCYAINLRTCSMLRNCTCAHVGCYAIALAHMLDATQLHLGTCSMLRNCTWAHVRCYAIALWNSLVISKICKIILLKPYNPMSSVLNSCVWTRICPSSSSSNT